MRAPLAFVAGAFGSGIALAWWLNPPTWLLAAVAGGIGVLAFRWQDRRSGAARAPKRLVRLPSAAASGLLLIGIAAMGAFRAGVDAHPPTHSIANYLTATPQPERLSAWCGDRRKSLWDLIQPQPVTCEGVIVSDVEWIRPAYGPARRQGWLEITRIQQGSEQIPSCGRVLLKLHTHRVQLAYGDRARLSGSIRGPRPSLKRDEDANEDRKFDEGHWLWLHGASGVLTVTDPEAVTKLGTVPSLWIRYRRWVASFRWQLKQLARSLLEPLEAGYLEALLLGDGQGIPRQTWEVFRRSGTLHVLVVSGLHVGLIGLISGMGLSLLRVPRVPQYLGLSGILVTYCVLTGMNPSILRATIMGILLCLGRLGGYEVSALNGLGLAALLILAFDPRALADVSFQLSFAAVLGLLVLSPPLMKRLVRREESVGRFWYSLAQAFAVSCGAWVATSPVIAWHFRMFTPIAIVANLIVVPWSSILIATGFVLCLVGLISGWAAAPVAASFSGMVVGLNRVVTWLATLPGASWKW